MNGGVREWRLRRRLVPRVRPRAERREESEPCVVREGLREWPNVLGTVSGPSCEERARDGVGKGTSGGGWIVMRGHAGPHP